MFKKIIKIEDVKTFMKENKIRSIHFSEYGNTTQLGIFQDIKKEKTCNF